MTKNEALEYCYKHKDQYIRDFDSIAEGIRSFDCLIAIIEEDTITPDQIKDYGMDYKDENEWSKTPPNSEGWYWYCSGNEGNQENKETPPQIVYIEKSPKQNKFQVGVNYLGRCINMSCDSLGGWWKLVDIPNPPKSSKS